MGGNKKVEGNHGRSQGQIFTEGNMLITSSVVYVVKCSLEDLTSRTYLI